MALKTLVVRIPTDHPRSQDREVLEVLKQDRPENLPFDLPEFFEWPEGPQSISRRGRLLMLAGIKYMKQHYSKKLMPPLKETSFESIEQKRRIVASVEMTNGSRDPNHDQAKVASSSADLNRQGDQEVSMDQESSSYDVSLFQ
jgi:hypothetical protein